MEDLNILIEESEIMQARIKKEKKVPFPQQTGKASLFENELSEESGYRYVLHIFNEAYTRVLNRELQALHSSSKRTAEKKQAIGKLTILIKRFVFLREVAQVNRELLKMAMQDHEVTKTIIPIKRPGEITVQQTKVNGKMKGVSLFHAKLSLLSRSQFKNGLYQGQAELFYSNGQRSSLQQLNQGVWHGKQEFYYSDGTLKTMLNYDHGKLMSAQLYHPDGTIKLQRDF